MQLGPVQQSDSIHRFVPRIPSKLLVALPLGSMHFAARAPDQRLKIGPHHQQPYAVKLVPFAVPQCGALPLFATLFIALYRHRL